MILPLDEHIFSKKADTYVDNFSIICKSCETGTEKLLWWLMPPMNLKLGGQREKSLHAE